MSVFPRTATETDRVAWVGRCRGQGEWAKGGPPPGGRAASRARRKCRAWPSTGAASSPRGSCIQTQGTSLSATWTETAEASSVPLREPAPRAWRCAATLSIRAAGGRAACNLPPRRSGGSPVAHPAGGMWGRGWVSSGRRRPAAGTHHVPAATSHGACVWGGGARIHYCFFFLGTNGRPQGGGRGCPARGKPPVDPQAPLLGPQVVGRPGRRAGGASRPTGCARVDQTRVMPAVRWGRWNKRRPRGGTLPLPW